VVDGQGYILIADDNADSRLILSQMLTNAGYEVKLAENGL
jgi:CheY-like chemotaxis protein